MKTSVPSARCSLTARANPARLLKLAGVATTDAVPRTRWARWFLVEVLPNEPVTATTVGATRLSRRLASVTKCAERRRSTGAVRRHAASTSRGTTSAATTAATEARPVTTPIAITTISRVAHTPARVRRRRVQARAAVLPLSDRPTGPPATARAVTTPASGHHTETTAAASATEASPRLRGVTVHHLTANRAHDPPRQRPRWATRRQPSPA